MYRGPDYLALGLTSFGQGPGVLRIRPLTSAVLKDVQATQPIQAFGHDPVRNKDVVVIMPRDVGVVVASSVLRRTQVAER
jgi:hypothetical protein